MPMSFPTCQSLSPLMVSHIQELALDWADDPARQRVARDVTAHWDRLLNDWAADISLPLLVRKFSTTEGRGNTVQHASGRVLVPADNSPAHWAFALAYFGVTPTLEDIHKWFDSDAIPVAWIFKTEERATATYLGKNASIRYITEHGWKVCHKQSIGLARRGSISRVPETDLKHHFIHFLAPSNIFVIPKTVGGLGELPHFIETIVGHESGNID